MGHLNVVHTVCREGDMGHLNVWGQWDRILHVDTHSIRCILRSICMYIVHRWCIWECV